jgi:uncharacterized protein (TIGR02588 family)
VNAADRKPEKGSRHPKTRRQAPVLEWIAAGVGLVLAVAVVSFVAVDAINRDGAPAAIVVEAGPVSSFAGGFTLEIHVRNGSASTAAQVQVEGMLLRGGQSVEVARATFDYVPGNSERRGGMFFASDPREHEVRLRALGYAEP